MQYSWLGGVRGWLSTRGSYGSRDEDEVIALPQTLTPTPTPTLTPTLTPTPVLTLGELRGVGLGMVGPRRRSAEPVCVRLRVFHAKPSPNPNPSPNPDLPSST